jgi:hypothetical protein
MSREKVQECFAVLAEEGAIVEDGTWTERYIDKILDPQQAAAAAVEAIGDDEVMAPHGIAMALAFIECVPRSAVAAALRKLWLEGGVFSEEPEQVANLFREALKAPEALMTPAEASALGELPEYVCIFRGQLHGDLPDQPSGMSWTLKEEVADWYAAPIPGQALRGRVLSALVPRHAVMALFLARAEVEVIVDPAVLQGLSVRSRPGRSDEFPPHLMAGKSLFF